MRTPVDVSVVIVTYNSRSFIDDCISSVETTVRRHRYEVLVVDNASGDGTADHVRRNHRGAEVIDMGRNAGFAAANNRAFEVAQGRHMLLLNGDATVEEHTIDELAAFLDSHPAAGGTAPKLVNPDGTDQGTARSFPTPAAAILGRRSPLTRIFPGNRYARRYLTGKDHAGRDPFRVDWVSGACLMVPRVVVDEVGPLDETYFMYWEDADWCRRITDAGFGIWCVPSVQAVHAEGGSRRGWSAAQVRHFHRSAYRYYAKHHLRGSRAVLRPVAAAVMSARAAVVIACERARDRWPGWGTARVVPSGHAPRREFGELP